LERPINTTTEGPTFPASHHDLLRTDVATFVTIGSDGFPQATALWFLYEDGLLKLSLNTTRQKTRNLQRDPHVTLFILDRANPYRTLEVRARAEVAPGDDYAFADRVGQSAAFGGSFASQANPSSPASAAAHGSPKSASGRALSRARTAAVNRAVIARSRGAPAAITPPSRHQTARSHLKRTPE